LYLIYYAVVARVEDETEAADPFNVNRLLMIALVSGVLAHFVEIHFGIAIASTRTHFFVYVALMFLVGHFLPSLKEVPETAETEEEPSKMLTGRELLLTRSLAWSSRAPTRAATSSTSPPDSTSPD
jgi:hypothetical protein